MLRHYWKFGLLSLVLFTALPGMGQDKYKKVYQTTIDYQKEEHTGSLRFKCVFDAFFGEPTEKAMVEVLSHDGCEPSVIDVSVDIYSGNTKVSTKTFTNLISFDVSGSPSWGDLWPGVSAERVKELYKNGYTIRNARLASASFSGCEEEQGASSAGASDGAGSEGGSSGRGETAVSEEASHSETTSGAEEEEEEEDKEEKTEEDESSGGGAQTDAYIGARAGASEAEQRAAAKRRQAAREKQKREQEARQRMAYQQWAQEQNRRNAQMGGAAAASAAGMLYLLGEVIYRNMGRFEPESAYRPGQFNGYARMHFGYSLLLQPAYFNSEQFDGVDYTRQTEYTYVYPVNFDFSMALGFDHGHYGAEGFAQGGIGTSLLFDNFQFPSWTYGGMAYAGLPFLKGFLRYTGGGRNLSLNQWYLAEESGSGKSHVRSQSLEYGLRITWGQFVRHHLRLGLVMSEVRPSESSEFDGDFRVQDLPELRSASQTNPLNLFKGWEDFYVPGYRISWRKDHHFQTFITFYPTYPYSGIRAHSLDSDPDAADGDFFFAFGFYRAIDAYFH